MSETQNLVWIITPNPLEYDPLRSAFNTISPHLDETIQRAIGPSGQRPQTVGDLRTELAAIAQFDAQYGGVGR